jgi:hypothetical protein
MKFLAYILFYLGGYFCGLNFYLSCLRYPLYRVCGGEKDEYQWISGAPLVGSLLVGISLISLHKITWMLVLGLILIVLDTGGLHWFLGTMFYHEVLRKEKDV